MDASINDRLRAIHQLFKTNAMWAPLTELEPDLYLGGIPDPDPSAPAYLYTSSPAIYIKHLSIGAIISITDYPVAWKIAPEIDYMNIVIGDHASASVSSDLETWFPRTTEFIDNARSKGKKVLVHCHMGISRSPTIVAAYYVNKKIPLEEVIKTLVDKRPIIGPNIGFLRALIKWEDTCMR